MAAPKGNKYAYKNPLSGRPKVWTDEIIEKEAQALVEWAQSDEAIVFREFPSIRGYVTSTFYEFAEKNEVFAEAFNYARDLIGVRREKLYIEKNSDRPYLKYANYHDDKITEFERKEKEFDSKLKKDNEKPHEKVVFEVNYNAGAENPIEILPKTLSDKNTPSA